MLFAFMHDRAPVLFLCHSGPKRGSLITSTTYRTTNWEPADRTRRGTDRGSTSGPPTRGETTAPKMAVDSPETARERLLLATSDLERRKEYSFLEVLASKPGNRVYFLGVFTYIYSHEICLPYVLFFPSAVIIVLRFSSAIRP